MSTFYKDNISLCCHVLIAETNNIVFPLGVQLISPENNRMSYTGTDYTFFDNLDHISKQNCYIMINEISTILSRNGYRGICGYDFLLVNHKPILIEINPRYMGSSYLINHVLLKAINLSAFRKLVPTD